MDCGHSFIHNFVQNGHEFVNLFDGWFYISRTKTFNDQFTSSVL